MSTQTSLKFATLALGAIALAACQDGAPASVTGASRAPSLASTTTVGDTTYTNFRVDPKDNRMIVIVGTHKLDIPPGSICDVATSGYGPTLWDAPCTPSATSVDFVAKTWNDAAGHPRIVITPDVRFVPGKVVTMYMKDKNAALDATSTIGWCATGATTCVDESKTDRSLAPSRDGNGGYVSRRVKHFSGYTVIVGLDCEDPWSCELDLGLGFDVSKAASASRAAGYITTTGHADLRRPARHDQR